MTKQTTDWRAWHEEYDDPASSLSRRLVEVRRQVRRILVEQRPRQVVSLCAGDGRDLIPLLAAESPDTRALLVELDPWLAETARVSAAEGGLTDVEVRTADAGLTDSLTGFLPADLLLVCGVFGNVEESGIGLTIASLPSLLAPGGYVVWTRGAVAPVDPGFHHGAEASCGDSSEKRSDDSSGGPAPVDPAERVRGMFGAAGFAEVAFVRPDDAGFRVGVHRLTQPPTTYTPGVRLFEFAH